LGSALEKQITEWIKGGIKLEDAIREFEKRYIDRALKEHNDNRSHAARSLGIHRNTLINKVKILGLATRKPPHRIVSRRKRIKETG